MVDQDKKWETIVSCVILPGFIKLVSDKKYYKK